MGGVDERHGRPRRRPSRGRHVLRLQRLHAGRGPPRRARPRPTSSTRGPTTPSASGEDGPTHQPVEQLAAVRAMPGLRVIRPADANETAQAWRIAVDSDGPTALILSRQELPVLAGDGRTGRSRGGPRGLRAAPSPRVRRGPGGAHRHGQRGAAVPGRRRPARRRRDAARVVSFPSWDLFAAQPEEYRLEVLPDGIAPSGRRGGQLLRLGALRRRHRRHRPLRRLGSGRGGPGGVRLHPPARRRPRPPPWSAEMVVSGDGARRHATDTGERTPMTALHDLYRTAGTEPLARQPPPGLAARTGTWPELVSQGIRGVTSNPTIFAKAIEGQDDLRRAVRRRSIDTKSVEDAYWDLVIDDIGDALAVLRPVYDSSGGADGFVSVEVAPALAHDTEGTIAAARDLHQRIDRPNLLVKIPATAEGVPAIRPMIGEGRSINVTLIFSIDRYDEVIEAYLSRARGRWPPPGRTTSPGWPAWPRSSSAGWTPRWTAGSRPGRRGGRPTPPSCSRCGARPRWPRPAWPTPCSGSASPDPAGRPWPPRGPGSNARCGPRPRPRTRPIPTSPTWTRSSGPTPSTPCPTTPSPTSSTTARWPAPSTLAVDEARRLIDRLAEAGIDMADVVRGPGGRGRGLLRQVLRRAHAVAQRQGQRPGRRVLGRPRLAAAAVPTGTGTEAPASDRTVGPHPPRDGRSAPTTQRGLHAGGTPVPKTPRRAP